jgi:ABC-2 type transport system ATP-binding protein
MEVPMGRITAFLGANGAGKTTTIKLMLGLLRQDAGEVHVLGTDSRKLGPTCLQQIAYVSENQKLPLWMTVAQLLDFCRPLYPTWDVDLEAALLKRFELNPKQKLKHLSRGQQMKASLLSNLAYRPKLVVLDEPFSGLDPLVREELIEGLLEFTEEGGWTVFISSHDIDEVESLADHVAIIDKGHLQLNESAEALLARFKDIEISLNAPSDLPHPTPKDWLNMEQSGRILRFTHRAWTETKDVRKDHPILSSLDTSAISVRPLSLRKIFIRLAQTYRLNRPA